VVDEVDEIAAHLARGRGDGVDLSRSSACSIAGTSEAWMR